MSSSIFHLPSSSSRAQRRGSVYVFVLGIGTLLGATAIAACMVAQIDTRAAAQDNDSAEAAVLAESAVEYGLQKMGTTSNWRSIYTNNVETARIPLGRGTISFKLVDEADANLADDPLEPARLYGIGRVGKATRVYSVQCGPTPLGALKSAMTINGAIDFGLVGYNLNGATLVSSNSTIAGTLTNLGSNNFEAQGLISLLLATGGGYRKSLQAAKDMPDPVHVFDYYTANGKKMTNLPTSNGGLSINRVLIGPGNNPFTGGTGGAKSIYYIDCAGSTVNIQSARIVGTLVLLNCGGCTIQSQLNWEPAVTGYPALLVQGNLNWKTNTSTLSESSAGVNFNPTGTPYPYNFGAGGGASNTNQTDTYPTQIAGIVYCTGTFDSSNNPVLKKGLIIAGGSWSPTGAIDLTYDSAYIANPAPGFLSPTLSPVTGTWRREQAP